MFFLLSCHEPVCLWVAEEIFFSNCIKRTWRHILTLFRFYRFVSNFTQTFLLFTLLFTILILLLLCFPLQCRAAVSHRHSDWWTWESLSKGDFICLCCMIDVILGSNLLFCSEVAADGSKNTRVNWTQSICEAEWTWIKNILTKAVLVFGWCNRAILYSSIWGSLFIAHYQKLGCFCSCLVLAECVMNQSSCMYKYNF